jgi:hypothetical protein
LSIRIDSTEWPKMICAWHSNVEFGRYTLNWPDPIRIYHLEVDGSRYKGSPITGADQVHRKRAGRHPWCSLAYCKYKEDKQCDFPPERIMHSVVVDRLRHAHCFYFGL